MGFGDSQRSVCFLFDSNFVLRPNGFISTLLLAASVQFRFRNISQLNILSKVDLIDEDQIDMMERHDLEIAFRALVQRNEFIENRFRHIHVNNQDGTDICKECGIDLRDPIHVRITNDE